MTLTKIISNIGLSAVLFTGTGANLEHQKKEKTIQTTTSKIEKLITLNDTIRHTFVIDDNNSIKLLLNQFQTFNGKIEKYVQLQDCVGNTYSIYVRDDYYQVTRIDTNNDDVIWYNEKMSPSRGVVRRKATDEDDAVDPVLSVYELINFIKSHTPVITPEGEIVYTIECV